MTLKITLAPDKEREIVQAAISVVKKLAGPRAVEAKVSVGLINGKAIATEYRSPQMELPTTVDQDDGKVRKLRGA